MEQEKIFFNYAKADKEEMRLLAQELQKYDKIVVTLPKESSGKEGVMSQTLREIEKSRLMLACISEGFNHSPLCQAAWGMAYARGVPVLGVSPVKKDVPCLLRETGVPVYHIYELDGLVELFSVLEPDAKPVRLVHTAQDVLESLRALPEKKEKTTALRPKKNDLEYYEEIISLLKGEKKR